MKTAKELVTVAGHVLFGSGPENSDDLAKAVIESLTDAEIVRWLPIESAPKDGTEIIVCNMNQGGVKKLIWWNKVHCHWVQKGDFVHMQDTHWADIPKGPSL